MIIDVVLAFIKVFRLRDKTSLSSIVVKGFDESAVEHSKAALGVVQGRGGECWPCVSSEVWL